ncbi:uncharacterized protein LOC110901268 [Helianthus annuus]|uniref:uncharacterized protein LOC110901268 n=1 Tax=Helianthus annuus TaxID=4232 RepID=UPI000B8FF6C0|nr:uncharacterized protein LOC110901268 [Helianthus annuus]
MLGSLDCMHWDWAACPTAWKGQHHRGDHNSPTTILQAVASQDLWIWHAYFGMAGANNDIAVLMSSNLFDDVIDEVEPDTSLYANDVEYKYGYYLTDGIYPEWATLVKTLSCPDDEKRLYFKKKQESARKDIERAFGVLKKDGLSSPNRRGYLKKGELIAQQGLMIQDQKNIIKDHEQQIGNFVEENKKQFEKIRLLVENDKQKLPSL